MLSVALRSSNPVLSRLSEAARAERAVGLGPAPQYGYGAPVSRDGLQPGDLVFFDGLGHVGIYVGGGSFIHAPHTGDVVKVSSLSGWYSSTFVGARRL